MGERVLVTVQQILNRLGQLIECIDGGIAAPDLKKGIEVIEVEVKCLGDQARVKELKEERDTMLSRHLRYSEGIRHAIGDDNRQKRHTGEPAQSDRREIVAMLARIKGLEAMRADVLAVLDGLGPEARVTVASVRLALAGEVDGG